MKNNTAYNRQIEINNYQKKFKIPFEMKDDAIDTRTMADNYENGIIPLEDIAQAIDVVLGPDKKPKSPTAYDPKNGLVKFGWVDWKDMYLWPRFQRDVAPNHLYKIECDFEHTSVLLPTAIRVNGMYMLWDGHHTAQEMRRQNYTSFPIWYIDVENITEDTISRAGFTDRIEYAVWLAGQNMIRINSKNKRKLHAYDEYMILLETKDGATTAMNNILTATSFTAKRNPNTPNAFSQIKSGQTIYDMADDYGIKGKYLKRALQFHNQHWKTAAAELEIWRPMSLIYRMAEVEGFDIDAQFDQELGDLFIKIWGDPCSTQLGLKENYEQALHSRGFTQPRDHDQWRVYDSIINLYNKEIGRIQLPQALCRW
jgi:hypothetical protein